MLQESGEVTVPILSPSLSPQLTVGPLEGTKTDDSGQGSIAAYAMPASGETPYSWVQFSLVKTQLWRTKGHKTSPNSEPSNLLCNYAATGRLS